MDIDQEGLDLQSIFNRYLQQKNRAPKRTIGEYWPSQIFVCIRKQYYSVFLEERPSEAQLKLFEAGNLVHEFLANLLSEWGEKNKVKVLKEVPIRIPHHELMDIVVSGRADDLIFLDDGSRRYLVEVKTTKNLEWLISKEALPKKEHLAQLNFYLRAYPNSHGILLYVDRSTFKMRQFDVDFNQQLYRQVMDRVKVLHGYITRHLLPPPEAKETGQQWMCKECYFSEMCDKQQNPK